MNTEIIKIIEGGLARDRSKVFKFAQQLAKNAQITGEERLAKRINNLLNKEAPEFVTTDDLSSIPVDSESRFDIAEISHPFKEQQKAIFSLPIEKKIKTFIDEVKKSEKIHQHGLEIKHSLLLYGPPGCGKSTVANYISNQLQLPLITARLDAIISSLLGSTAKNIKQLFSFAANRPCILLLDEFDAVAKARNDQHELGELKRVVNSLIQNIDDFTENNILIAATNHHELLDKAIWRRFNTTIQILSPDLQERDAIMKMYLGSFPNNFLYEKKRREIILELMEGYSPADIKTVINNSIKSSILRDQNALNYIDLLTEILMFRGEMHTEKDIVIFLHTHGVTQESIQKTLGIKRRQLQKILSQ